MLSIVIIEAKNLVPDEKKRPIAPYVKLRVGSLDAARSRTVSEVDGIAKQERGERLITNPEWRERMELRISSPNQPIYIEVKSRYILVCSQYLPNSCQWS